MATEAPETGILEEAGIKAEDVKGTRKITIDLTHKRSGRSQSNRWEYSGDVIVRESLQGSASVSFSENDAWKPLAYYPKITRREGFNSFYIKNDAQPGKELVLQVGGQSRFDVEGFPSPQQIVNEDQELINPAVREGWENFKTGQDTSSGSDETVTLNGGTSLTIPYGAVLIIKALQNTTDIWVNGEASGYPLSPGETLELSIRDVAFVDFHVPTDGGAGDGVAWIVEQK